MSLPCLVHTLLSVMSPARKRPPDDWVTQNEVPLSPERNPKSCATLGGDMKRRRTDILTPSTPSKMMYPAACTIPSLPLLYHLALSAHHAASRHLQQLFIPSSVTSCADHTACPPILSDLGGSKDRPHPFVHDPWAGHKAMDLLLLAFDLLRMALASHDLTEKEKVAFALEFGKVGMKALATTKHTPSSTGKQQDHYHVVVGRLQEEVQETIASGVRYGRLI